MCVFTSSVKQQRKTGSSHSLIFHISCLKSTHFFIQNRKTQNQEHMYNITPKPSFSLWSVDFRWAARSSMSYRVLAQCHVNTCCAAQLFHSFTFTSKCFQTLTLYVFSDHFSSSSWLLNLYPACAVTNKVYTQMTWISILLIVTLSFWD